MMDRTGIECDNCGECISNCGTGALGYHLPRNGGRASVKGGMVLLLMLLAAPPAFGHHILGIPHYAYDEQYPQTPVLTYRVNAGPHEVKMTGYPGIPKPGEACSYHVYIKRLDTEVPFDDRVTLQVFRDKLIGEDPVIYGPVEAKLEQSVYKFYPRFEAEANYTVRIRYEAEGAPWIIDLPVVVGEPGSPWTVLGSAVLGIAAFLVIIRAARIKMRRHAESLAIGGAT
jgi:ferredoxin